MKMMKLATVLCWIALPATASAQVAFPAESAWIPLRCNDIPMIDGFQDQAGAIDERDIVGNAGAPAGLRAGDETNLYLRMRLEEDPAPGGAVRSFSWGMQFDTDGDLTNYEVMVLADGLAGAAGVVTLFRNTTTTLRNDPADPAEESISTYPFAMNARTGAAAGTNEGGTADFFLDIAVPWSALRTVGLDRETRTFVWAASSSSANSLNGDLACHDGASGPGPLGGTASEETTGDPTQDPGGGGGGTGRLEGGGGCAAGGAGSPLAALGLLGLLGRRRARRIRGRGTISSDDV